MGFWNDFVNWLTGGSSSSSSGSSNTNTGRTQEELARIQSVNEIQAASQKKNGGRTSSASGTKKNDEEKGGNNAASSRSSQARRYMPGVKTLIELPDARKKKKEEEPVSAYSTGKQDAGTRYNPLVRTATKTPEKSVEAGNKYRTEEELQRISTNRELEEYDAYDWLQISLDGVAQKYKHNIPGTGILADMDPVGENGAFDFTVASNKEQQMRTASTIIQNFDKYDDNNKLDAAKFVIQVYGINDDNRDMLMNYYDDLSTVDKMSLYDVAINVLGSQNTDVLDMQRSITSADDYRTATEDYIFAHQWGAEKQNQTGEDKESLAQLESYVRENGITDNNRDFVMTFYRSLSTVDQLHFIDTISAISGIDKEDKDSLKTIAYNAPDIYDAYGEKEYNDSRVEWVDEFGNVHSVAKPNDEYHNWQAMTYNANMNAALQYEEEQRLIDEYADKHYTTGEAYGNRMKAAVSSWWTRFYDAGVSALVAWLNQGQDIDNVGSYLVDHVRSTGKSSAGLFGTISAFVNNDEKKGFFQVLADVGMDGLYDLFTAAGLPLQLLSKAFLDESDVRKIEEKLMGVTSFVHDEVALQNRILESSDVSPAHRFAMDVIGTAIEMVPTIVTGIFSGGASLAVAGVSAGGASARQAYDEGATIEESVRYGLAIGAAEAMVEKAFTGFGFQGKGIFSGIGEKTGSRLVTNATRKAIEESGFLDSTAYRVLKRFGAAGGEATEEAVMEIISPYLERASYNPDAMNATLAEIGYAGGLGAAVGAVLGIPVMVAETANAANQRKGYDQIMNDYRQRMWRDLDAKVADGSVSEKDARSIKAEVEDLIAGRGSLNVSSAEEEVKITGEALDTVYDSFEQARDAMMKEARSMADGEQISVNYIEDGEVKTFTTSAQGGALALGTTSTASAEYQKIAKAKNITERSGYQLGVREEVINEVSALSQAIGKEVEFYYGESQSDHGYVDEKTGKIYVNANSSQSPARAVIGHEVTHLLEGSGYWVELAKMVKGYYGSSYESRRNERIAAYANAGKPLSETKDAAGLDEVDTEVIAMFVEEKLLTDPDVVREVVRTDRSIAQKIIDWINKVIQKITGTSEQKFLADARALWTKALEEEGNKKAPRDGAIEDGLVEHDGALVAEDAGAEVRHSIGNNDKLMDAAEKRNKTTKAVPVKVLNAARKARSTIKEKYADLFIADSMSERRSPLVGNDSYSGSLDNATICTRSLTMESIVELVAKRIGRPLRNEESIVVAQELMQYTGDRAECLYCYQANAKRGFENALANFADQRRTVIENHQNGMDEDTNYKLMMDYDFEKGKWGKKDTPAARERFETFIKIANGKIEMASDLSFANTRILNENIKDPKVPKVIKDQLKQARKYAQGAVKAHGRVYYAVYNGQIITRVNEKKITEWNNTYGLRMYSFSDFSPAFILENMQMVTDASVRGLKMLAYTKEAEFVEIFGGTGMAINISVAGVPDGQGGYHSDGMQGMNWEQAKTLRAMYPEVGTVYVAKSDAEVEWAMEQEWIDTVIPFHISYGSGMMQRNMGWKNYSGQQSEKKKKGWTSDMKKTIYPSEHQNNMKTYLRLCEENKLTPKFPQFLKDENGNDNPNYMKLVKETRRASKDIKPVQPVFDLEAAEATLEQFAKNGGYNPILGGTQENREYIADEITEKVKTRAPEVKARDMRMSIGKDEDAYNEADFADALSEWDSEGRPDGETFILGRTGDVLQGLGAFESDIYMLSEKINKIFNDHPEMGLVEIKKIPRILNEPILILKSQNVGRGKKQNSRLVLFGSVKAQNGKPVLVALDLKPVEKHLLVTDMQKVTSAYTKTKNPVQFVEDSDVLYVDSNKKRASSLLRSIGFQMPIELKRVGSIGSISYKERSVNIEGVPFKDVRKSIGSDAAYLDAVNRGDMEEAQRMVDEAAKAAGYDVKAYHGTDADFTVFDPSYARQAADIVGMYFSPNEQEAEDYGENVMPVYLRLKNPAKNPNWKPYVTDDAGLRERDKLMAQGHDGVIIEEDGETQEYVVFDPDQVKSADPVNYDDTGNVIPLSERFNEENDDIRWSVGRDAEYMEAVENNDMDTAERLVRDAAEVALADSKLRKENGKLRVVYHGTNTGSFTVFDPKYIGMSSGDSGYFGMGFYFAFTQGEAAFYGASRVIPAYINLTNPFDFQSELATYNGKRALTGYAPDAVRFMNFADKFPDIAKHIKITVRQKPDPNDYFAFEGKVTDISLREFADQFKNVIDNVKFKYEKVENWYGEKETIVTADNFNKRFYGTANELDVAYEYLSSAVYDYIDMYSFTHVILDYNREFTAALKEMGYDGVVQSMDGDEVVAFYPEQIKSADPVTYDEEGNVIPLSERFNEEKDDIRWSVGRDAEYMEAVENNDMDTAERLVRDTAREADRKTIAALEKALKKAENQKEFSKQEKEDLKNKIKETKKEANAELKRRAKEAKAERSASQKSLAKIAKEYEKGNAEKARGLVEEEQKRINPAYKKSDKERRSEMRDAAVKEYFKNRKKPAEGTAKAVLLKNKNVKSIVDQFRRETITQLVNSGRLAVTNDNVILDENQQEIAVRKGDMWDFSEVKNNYTPRMGNTLLAKKEGIDVDQFFTIYANIKDIQTRPKEDFKTKSRREEVLDYIHSLNLKKNQKEFIYDLAAEYASSTMPNTFLDGGRVNEEKGNLRGRMIEALDNIALDMFRGHMKEDSRWASEESPQIRQKDINDFVELIYGKEDSTEKDEFLDRFTRMIIDYSEQMETARLINKTNLLVNNPKQSDPLKVQIVRAYRQAKRNFLCEGEAYERMADEMNNPLIRARYYQAKAATATANEMINGKHQRNLSGEIMGKSLYQIFKPVFDADTKAKNSNGMELLTELVHNRHDIYRLKNGKGYTDNTIEECEVIVENISKAHPELVKVADELVEYCRNLLKMCVECGRISQKDYDYFVAKYPYYVPTFRLMENEYIDRNGKIHRDKEIMNTAEGGNLDVLPLWDQVVRRTNEMVKACKKNQLAFELVNSIRRKGHEKYVSSATKTIDQGSKENEVADLGQIEDVGRNKRTQEDDNFIPWYCNGVKYDVDIVDPSLLYGWDRINYRMDEQQWLYVLRKFNNFRRAVSTQYNPTFWLTNHLRDLSDMILYNQHSQRLPKYLLLAYAEMFGGKIENTSAFQKLYKKTTGEDFVHDERMSDSLERYLARGASNASIFEYENTNAGRKTGRGKVRSRIKKPLEIFDSWNFMFEQIPRLAVFNETIDRLTEERSREKNKYTDEEIETIAAFQAADATVNFGRSGTVVKNMNTYGFTFLNAGVQGMDRARRMFTQIKDKDKKTVFLNMIGLALKIFVMGYSAHLLLGWIYGGDDEYADAIREFLYGDDKDKVKKEYLEMSDYQLTNYFILNIGGTWFRAPQGRLSSFLYGFGYYGEKVWDKEMDALDLLEAQWELATETVLFGNPVTNNILGPIIDVTLRNKDAWGNDIVSEYEDMGDGFHYLEYDEETSAAARKAAEFGHWLTAERWGKEGSRFLDFSPKKLDYVMKQYFGSYANLLMPFLDGSTNIKDKLSEGLADTLFKKFYIDPAESNRLAGDYYDLREEFENIANAYDGDSPYAVAAKVFNDYNEMIKPIREEITATSNDPELTDAEKAEKIISLREEMNQLYRDGIADAQSVLEFATENYTGKDYNNDIYEEWISLYKGADWRTKSFDKTEQGKFDGLVAAGLDDETALAVMDRLDALEPVEGKSSVSEFQKVKAIADMGLSKEQEIAAMSAALNESAYAKFKSTTDYGVTAQVWTDFQMALEAADYANNMNGSYDQEEKEAALYSMDISNETRAALWQIKDNQLGKEEKTAEWKAGRNPFDPSVGVVVVENYMAQKVSMDEEDSESAYDSAALAPVSLESIVSPVSGVGTITSRFGYRDTGIPGASNNHRAIDIAAAEGTPIGAALSGVVQRTSTGSGYGNSIEIISRDEAGNTIICRYSHLSSIGVEEGDIIRQGQQIGKMGSTGISSSSHLDFKISINGEWKDPEQYIDFTAAGVVDTNGYSDKTGSASSGGYSGSSSGGSSSGGSSSGGGRSGGSSSSSGSSSGGSSGSRVASVSSSRRNSSSSSRSGSSGSGTRANPQGLTLPSVTTASTSAARSTDNPRYGSMGLTLPRVPQSTVEISYNKRGTSTSRTARSDGRRFWDPNILS